MITISQVILLFLAFCLIAAAMELVKLLLTGVIMRRQQKQRIDDLVSSIYRGFLDIALKIRAMGKE